MTKDKIVNFIMIGIFVIITVLSTERLVFYITERSGLVIIYSDNDDIISYYLASAINFRVILTVKSSLN